MERHSESCALGWLEEMREDGSPVPSFFKVIIRKQFPKILQIPPNFAPLLSSLSNRKTILEDPHGRCWQVSVSDLDGSLAFQQGWNDFFSDNGLEIGDFVIFHYVGTHFSVEMYDRSGCRKSILHPSSRSKSSWRPFTDRSSVKKQSSSQKNSIQYKSSVPSFSKIIYGEQFAEVLYIPPKFAPLVSALINRKTFLKDLHGQQWEVSVSKLGSDLAFRQGWTAFASDNGLVVGDFVTFHYRGSHFSVEIYDRSGCRKLQFPTGSGMKKRTRHAEQTKKKRTRPDGEYIPRDDWRRSSSDGSSMRNQSSSNSIVSMVYAEKGQRSQIPIATMETDGVAEKLCLSTEVQIQSKRDYIEDSCFGLGWENTDNHNEPRISVLDLSEFEPFGLLSFHAEGSKTAIEIGFGDRDHGTGNGKAYGQMANTQYASKSVVPIAAKNDKCQMLSRDMEQCEKKGETYPAISDKSLTAKRMAKEETVDANAFVIYSPQEVPLKLKAVAKHPSYLVLPQEFPMDHGRGDRGRENQLWRIRDPLKRLWPVNFHGSSWIKVLTGGWKDFSKANDIQLGDECIIRVKNKPEKIYAISVVKS